MAEWTAPHLSSQESICHEWTKLPPDQHLLIHIGKVYEFQSIYSNATHAADSLRCFFALHDILSEEPTAYSDPPTCGCKRLRGDCGAMAQSKKRVVMGD
jgi:hypothetical protein